LFGLFNAGTPFTLGSDLIVSGAVTATSTQVGGLVGRLNLFTAVHPFTFQGVSKTAGNITGGGSVGGVVGRLVFTVASPVTINGATVEVGVTSTGEGAGGLVGNAGSGGALLISGSTVTGPLDGASDLGGFVGVRSGTLTIQNSTVSSDVRSTADRVGGLIGSHSGATPTLTGNNLSDIVVQGVDHVGGWIGAATGFSIQGWRPTGVSLEASGTGAGGLVGLATDMAITASYSTLDVSGANAVGGLVGVLAGNSTLTESYVSGAVSGTRDVGGLVGEVAGGTVEDTYADGPVTGNSGVGGLVGLLKTAGQIKTSYAAGAVTGGADTGGLIGSNEDGAWDLREAGATQRDQGWQPVGAIPGAPGVDASLQGVEGVGDAEGNPVAVSPEGIAALLDLWPIFERFQIGYVATGLELEQEKNTSAPSPNGSTAGAKGTARPARKSAKPARK
jgi:hypothetical protein